MKTKIVRQKFLDFFRKNGHTILPSIPLIPKDDPTLLFVNAGMNAFKALFLGEKEIQNSRIATVQKCLRVGGKHNDLDYVGKSNRHLTFFEMLGNFSFGDYGKAEAIEFAWNLLKEFGIDLKRVWATVLQGDRETKKIWEDLLGNRVVEMGREDNFWSMGETGPCGACTELYYDFSQRGGSPLDNKGFLEFWNLVFIEYNNNGKELVPLKRFCIDTGMGLERMVSVTTGIENLFETDILREIISAAEDFFGIDYSEHIESFNVLADHLRSLVFGISDGVYPSNLDRGYILRKILRRAILHGKKIGSKEGFLADLAVVVVDIMGDTYPELKNKLSVILQILKKEEEGFSNTLTKSRKILSTLLKKKKSLSSEDAFKLKDTHGLPLPEIKYIAKEYGLEVNEKEFALLEEKASKLSARNKKDIDIFDQDVTFVGYDRLKTESKVIGLYLDKEVNLLQGKGKVVLDKTPFYGEKGGQVGDIGSIFWEDGEFVVESVHLYGNTVVHNGFVKKGTLTNHKDVKAVVDKEFRENVSRNHTATHLLQQVICDLFKDARQKGSSVHDKGFRFDFSGGKLCDKDKYVVEDAILAKINSNIPVESYLINYSEVTDEKMLVQEDYPEIVRVVNIGGYKELCGGTHLSSTGEVRRFRIVKSFSIGQSICRIEAVTGKDADRFILDKERSLDKISTIVGASNRDLCMSVAKLLEDKEDLEKRNRSLTGKYLILLSEKLLKSQIVLGGLKVVLATVDNVEEELNVLTKILIDKIKGVVVIGSKNRLFVRSNSVDSSLLVRYVVEKTGGTGGGSATCGSCKCDLTKGLVEARIWLEQFSGSSAE